MRLSQGRAVFLSWIGIAVPIAAFLLVMVLASGCTSTQGAVPGDTVRVTYRMAFPGGAIFETNENHTPLVFVVGSGQMIRGFDQAVVGMTPGQTKTVIIPPDQGYGIRNESMVGDVNTELLNQIMGELGKKGHFTRLTFTGIDDLIYRYQMPDNTIIYYSFRNITPETTTVDQNHPLAGRDLEATITLLEITE